jgi:protein-S-isoprenylcysteine O-methyltransferase Ste14
VFPWVINFGWLFLAAGQHSGMARQSFKQWLTRWIPAALERSLYVAVSGILLAALTLGWQPLPGAPLWHGPLWIAALSLLAALGVGLCCGWFDHATFFGLRQAWTGNANARSPLRIEGPYRYVRHPLMLGLLIALWAQPIMPPELLMMNVGLTVYILIAIRWEERDLVREFGAEYEQYRRKVPALIPFRVHV